MTEQQRAAMKRAVEALEKSEPLVLKAYQDNKKSAELYRALYAHRNAIADLHSIINQDAPPKQDVPETNFGNMAEPKIGCVNHDCDKCKAVQEPVAIVVAAEYEDGSTAGHRLEWRGRNEANDFPEGTEFYTAPQPVPVKTYHDGKPWPVAPKPWVGLTDAEIEACDCLHVLWTGDDDQELVGTKDFARAVEAKLKEKNHDH